MNDKTRDSPTSGLIKIEPTQSMNSNITEILRKLFKLLDKFLPQHPDLFDYLSAVMDKEFCPEDKVLYRPGDLVDKAYYVACGLVILYVKVRGKKLLVNIYRENEIVAIPAFHNGKASEFYLEAIAGTFLAYVTREQMIHVYATFDATNELSRKIMSRTESKIYKHLLDLTHKGIVVVERFYKRFPNLLLVGKLLTDAEVASYLNMTKGTLGFLRRKLLDDGAV
ncbi:MAG: Crp/Fnr family transcriptional regulator [Pedobacter sp.]|nr:MAG: Crp/Fnr family transcriptional regulator [Pedobacter sp.]